MTTPAAKKRRKVAAIKGFYCARCFTTQDLTLDHILPKVYGGTDDIENLQLLCGTCHRYKDQIPKQRRLISCMCGHVPKNHRRKTRPRCDRCDCFKYRPAPHSRLKTMPVGPEFTMARSGMATALLS